MANTAWNHTSLSDGPHEWRRAWHLGWVDAQNGGRWHPDYDRMSVREQIGYEQGRLHIRNLILSGLAVPIWCGDKAGARAAELAMAKAAQLVGHPVPAEFIQRLERIDA